MRRFMAAPLAALALFVGVSPAAATVQRDTWDTRYSLRAEEFCGFAVDVHDVGRDTYFHVSPDGWDWAKQWQGTRAFLAPSTDLTATFEWSWMTSQAVETRGQTAMTLLVSSYGSSRVRGGDGALVASNAGRITSRWHMSLIDGKWVLASVEPVSSSGPHDFEGDGFCEAMVSVLQP